MPSHKKYFARFTLVLQLPLLLLFGARRICFCTFLNRLFDLGALFHFGIKFLAPNVPGKDRGKRGRFKKGVFRGAKRGFFKERGWRGRFLRVFEKIDARKLAKFGGNWRAVVGRLILTTEYTEAVEPDLKSIEWGW